ncbi:MAG: ribosomal protein S18-alanine N-acetyltransferase [Deltaproteobacteria bacterium]|nr:ribosomal protein S18-alanine N-acetyltransferase [Deltaproteobacteria bacterium]
MSVQAGGELYLRSMTVADIDEVMAIETAAFASPWSRQFFLEELQATHAKSVLCQRDGKPIGYVIYWELPGELDIHNVAVHPQFRRQGVARAMLADIIEGATSRGFRRMTLEVRKSNDPAQTLYRSLGFEICGLRKGYYSDNGEDAWVMERKLAASRNDPLQS